jgi:hypothetical protein
LVGEVLAGFLKASERLNVARLENCSAQVTLSMSRDQKNLDSALIPITSVFERDIKR